MNKGAIKVIIFFIITILFSGIGYVFVKLSKNNYQDITINYSEKSNIDYDVYLKENSFFEKNHINSSENKTYIASLIDFIDVDFDYNIKFNTPLDGKYSYYIKGVINANKSNNEKGNYLSREFGLTEKVYKDFSNSYNIDINENINIDYDKYNSILKEFKDEYGLSFAGEMIVSLEIEEKINDSKLDEKKIITSSIPLNIPLTSQTIDIPITKSDLSNNDVLFKKSIRLNDSKFLTYKIVGYGFFVISSLFIYFLIKYGILRAKVVSDYHKKLRKILRMYDGILVNVEKNPSISKLNLIDVKSFEELIDAHSEVRKPINFSESKLGATFTLINEGNVWKYFLKKEKFFEDK